MWYLIQPNGVMKWTPVTADLRRAVAEEGLGPFDWRNADFRADGVIAGLALRYGMRSPAGILLDGAYVNLARRPAHLTKHHNREADNHAELQAADDELHQRTLGAADAELDRVLRDRLPDPELINHWVELGGRVQQPATSTIDA